MPNFKFTSAQKSNTEADIHIYGVIGSNDARWDDGTNNTAFAVVSAIKELAKKNTRLNVHINSPGGVIDEGLAIYNALKSSRIDIHTYNDGFVGSMASIIILAGITHFPKTSIYHLHRASSFASGNVNDFKEEIAALEVHENALIEAIMQKTGLTRDVVIANWFDGTEHFMSAEDAQKFGFVDVLEEETVAAPPAPKAQLEVMQYQRIAALYSFQESQEKPENLLQKLISKIENILNPATQSHENNHSNSNNNQKMNSLKSPVRLLALMAISEIALNADAKAELTIDQIMQFEAKLLSFENSVNSLTAQVTAKEKENADHVAEIAARDTKILALENQIKDLNATTPADDAQNPKTTDTTQDTEEGTHVSDDVINKLLAYNKSQLNY